jgi:hypothetical protein
MNIQSPGMKVLKTGCALTFLIPFFIIGTLVILAALDGAFK